MCVQNQSRINQIHNLLLFYYIPLLNFDLFVLLLHLDHLCYSHVLLLFRKYFGINFYYNVLCTIHKSDHKIVPCIYFYNLIFYRSFDLYLLLLYQIHYLCLYHYLCHFHPLIKIEVLLNLFRYFLFRNLI